MDYYNDVNDQNAGDDLALSRAIVIYGRQIRMDGGAYKDGDVYSMGINERGYLTNHAVYLDIPDCSVTSLILMPRIRRLQIP